MRHALSYALYELHRLVPTLGEELTIETLIADRAQVANELRGRVTNLEQVRLESFKRTLRRVGALDDTLAAHLNAVYLKHRFEDIVLYDDVLPTLDALQPRYKKGIISNGNSYPERCGLDGRFQFVVFSQDHGVEKPDPRLFHIALQQSGCVNDQLLHVGDSLHDDVAGAQNAGVRSVWLNRSHRENGTGVRPDFEIPSLTELVRICNRPMVHRGGLEGLSP